MRLLYIKYPKCQTLSGTLSWSHYTELLSISDDLSRSFYEKQCIKELKGQRQSGLFERLALSKDKKGVLHHKNHTEAFWNEVDKIMPDYPERKEWLKKNGAGLNL